MADETVDGVAPADEHNLEMVRNLHPRDWSTPVPADVYNLVVIGAGPAGLVSALGAAGLGGRVALVERHLLGGDCTTVGCVPSKAVIASGHAAHAVRDAGRYGVKVGEPEVDFGAAMERMRAIRAEISHHDAASMLADRGVDVFFGTASFSGPDTIAVEGDGPPISLSFRRAVIATGARALVPPIPGLDEVEVRTNETIFSLTERPERLVVVGAGPIGCELAQAFRRLGSEVTLVDQAPKVLPRDEADAAEIVQDALVAEGIRLVLGASVTRFEPHEDGRAVVLSRDDDEIVLVADEILLAIGRRANVESLSLDTAGIETHAKGVVVDDYLQTTNPNVYAAGDVASPWQFTHAADAMARIVIQNALFFGFKKVSSLVIPYATYTDPEVAHVGVTEEEAERRGLRTYTTGFDEVDRALTDGTTVGYCRIYADSKGRIHGATIVGRGAGDLLAEVTLAMTHGLTLGQIASTIHPYPTRSEVVKKCADAYNRTRLTPFASKVLRTILSWRR